jgi:hypothetical protein
LKFTPLKNSPRRRTRPCISHLKHLGRSSCRKPERRSRERYVKRVLIILRLIRLLERCVRMQKLIHRSEKEDEGLCSSVTY